MELLQQMNAACARVYDHIIASLKTDRGVHVETAIAAAGGLTGYELLRAAGVDLSALTPGTPVFNLPRVDDTGPEVISFIVDGCRRAGFAEQLPADVAVPPTHRSHKSHMEMMNLLGPTYRANVDTVPLEPAARWLIPAKVAVRLILDGASVLPVAIGQTLAINAFVEGAKTVPPAIATSPKR